RGLFSVTNLSLGDMALSIEHVALDLASSPKAYMLVVAGALVASRATLSWGWETGGVILPGLVCLGWFYPIKVAATVGEALVASLLAQLVVLLPRARDWNLEGPRRFMLVLAIDYALKFVISSALGSSITFRTTDLYGLGYLLPSLLATK